MFRSLFLTAFLFGLACVSSFARAEVQGVTEAADNFQFWGDQIPSQAWGSSANSLREPASAAEHFDGDADDIFFDLTAAREMNEKVQDNEAMVMEPCDMNVSADEALLMEGDLERVRGMVSNQEPTFFISSGPSFGFSFIDSFLQQFAFDPVQDWLDRQLSVAQQIDMVPSVFYQYREEEDGDFEDGEEDNEDKDSVSLDAVSRFRFSSAMTDLMAGSQQEQGRTVSQSQSGYTEDGARWTSSKGVSQDGSSQWFSFSMSYNGEDEQKPSLMAREQKQQRFGQDTYPKEESIEDEDDYFDEPEDMDVDWAAWMDSYDPSEMTSVLRVTPNKRHVICAVLIGCIAGSVLALVGLYAYRAHRGAAEAKAVSGVQEPLLEPVLAADLSEPCLVVAADHADLEKHYVNIKYVPLNGE